MIILKIFSKAYIFRNNFPKEKGWLRKIVKEVNVLRNSPKGIRDKNIYYERGFLENIL